MIRVLCALILALAIAMLALWPHADTAPGRVIVCYAYTTWTDNAGSAYADNGNYYQAYTTLNLVVVSPAYRDAPVWASDNDPLLDGMARYRLLQDEQTIVSGVQLADGDLWVDGVIYDRQLFFY